MINVVWAVVVVLALGVCLNLGLTFALIRRLRALEESVAPVAALPMVGARVDHFEVHTTQGRRVSQHDVSTGSIIAAFLSPSCQGCSKLIEALISGETVHPPWFIFVVAGDAREDADALALSVSSVGQVAVVQGNEVMDAFGGVAGFPTVVRLQDGTIAAAGHRIQDVVRSEPTVQT